MADIWKMIAWLLEEHFGWFLVVCAVAAIWLSAAAMLIEYAIAAIVAKIIVKRHRDMFREDWR